jgi:oligogalacturonide transporter
VYGFAAVVGLGTGGVVVMMYAIFPDIPDVDELRSGQRREGTYAALVTFIRKLSSALAIFAVSQMLQFAGYVPPVEQVTDGAARLVEQPQAAGFLLALRLIFVLVPLGLLALALWFAGRYPLTPGWHARLSRHLAAVRAGQPSAEDAAALRRELVG